MVINLTFKERTALKSLRSNDQIIIKNSDKGGLTVVLDKSQYQQEALRQLSYTFTYTKLTRDPTKEFKSKLFSLIDEGVYLNIFFSTCR